MINPFILLFIFIPIYFIPIIYFLYLIPLFLFPLSIFTFHYYSFTFHILFSYFLCLILHSLYLFSFYFLFPQDLPSGAEDEECQRERDAQRRGGDACGSAQRDASGGEHAHPAPPR